VSAGMVSVATMISIYLPKRAPPPGGVATNAL
jgi:hypothetical protein